MFGGIIIYHKITDLNTAQLFARIFPDDVFM
jgi:hypothetical protein